MFKKPSRVLIAAIYLIAGQANLQIAQQSPSHQEEGWTTVSAEQTVYGIRYAGDGRVWSGKNLVTTCPSNVGEVHISSPSPVKRVVALICKSTNGDIDKLYLVDTLHSLTIPVKLFSAVGPWVSWSPEESFALFDSGAEGGPPHLFLVDLRKHLSREIRFKQFDRANENQVFEQESLRWIDNNSLRVQLKIYGDDNKLHRNYPARVNLSPFSVSYGDTGQRSQPRTAASNSQPAANSNRYQTYVGKDLNVLLREVPDVKRRLIKLLGRNYQLFMKNLTVSSDMEDEQGFLKMHGLAPHMGTVEEAVFLLSFSSGRLHCAILSQRFGNRYKLFSEDPNSAPIALIDHLIYR